MTRVLMIQGTGSDVGKSLVVAGLARAFVQRGLRVAPFKPQNMSNNAAVCLDGGEIGRAQALQARAAKIDCTIDMNPVLLKPQGEYGAQIIVHGCVAGQAKARDYQSWKPRLLPLVMESFERLKSAYDLVIIEGAGSGAEINLRENDIANMGFARAADAPVVLVGDIDRGGVIAQLVGCKAVIDPVDADLIKGFIVNKFRGDASLFHEGMKFIEMRTGWRALGLFPFFDKASNLPEEDAFSLKQKYSTASNGIVIAAPLLPHIANFDDFDPLKAEEGVRVVFVQPGCPLPAEAKLVVLPGSKATISDLQAFYANGWDVDLRAHTRRGGFVFGICGGYQMLGRTIKDLDGIEGASSCVDGLGLLEVETVLTKKKTLLNSHGRWLAADLPVSGYEIHVGVTTGPDCARPVLRHDDGRLDGACARGGRIFGSYMHGVFTNDDFRRYILRSLGAESSELNFEETIEETLDQLAAHCMRHIDLDRLWDIAR